MDFDGPISPIDHILSAHVVALIAILMAFSIPISNIHCDTLKYDVIGLREVNAHRQ